MLKSLAGDTGTVIEFINSTVLTVDVFWIDYKGQEKQYATLAPGQSLFQSTFVSHPWCVKDRDSGVQLAVITGTAEVQTLEITRAHIRSQAGDKPVNLRIKNLTPLTLDLFWVDYQGNEVRYAVIEPHAEFQQGTYQTHPWLLKYHLYDDVLAVAIASEKRQAFDITPDYFRSKTGDKPVTLTINNQTPMIVDVYWVDYQGAEKYYFSLPRGGTYQQGTYATHPWIVRDKRSGVIITSVITPDYPLTVNVSTERLRSGGGSTAVNALFKNLTAAPVQVYWVDTTGGEKLYTTLVPGQAYRQGSFATHAWRIRNPTSRAEIGFYILTATPEQEITIQPDSTTPAGNAAAGFVRRQVLWNNRLRSYYQADKNSPWFYYLPDSFKIGRRANGQVAMTLQFSGPDDSLDNPEDLKATIDYHASPVTDTARLTAAKKDLRQYVPYPFPAGIDGPQLAPVDTATLRFRLRLPRAATSGGYDEIRSARVTMQEGIFDSLTLTLPDFQAVWDAIFSQKIEKTLFTGEVEITVGSNETERVPFEARFEDNPDTFFNAILDPQTQSKFFKTLEINTVPETFAAPPDRPQDQILVILADFGLKTVKLTAQQLSTKVKAYLSLRDVILHSVDPGIYRYQLKLIRRGRQQDCGWREATMEIVYPEVEV